jgi:hypothetical protein
LSNEGTLDRASAAVDRAIDDVRAYLASPEGKRVRNRVAIVLIAGSPAIMRLPGLRRMPWFRLLELAGGAALIIKAAEAIRDWEPASDPSVPGG